MDLRGVVLITLLKLCFLCSCGAIYETWTVSNFSETTEYKLGYGCLHDVHCLIYVRSSICKKTYCVCPNKKPVYDKASKSCIERYAIGNNCSYNFQCQWDVQYSICNDSSCKCPDEKPVYDNNQKSCLTRYDIGNNCSYNFQCQSDVQHSICKSFSCKCPDEKPVYDSKQKRCLTKSLGNFCVYDFTCQKEIGNSICQNFKCACPTESPLYDHVSYSCLANVKLPHRSFLPWTIILTVCVCISLVMGIIVFITIRKRQKTIANHSREVRLSIVSRLSRENSTDRNSLPSYDVAVHNCDTLPSYSEAVNAACHFGNPGKI